MTFSVSKAIQEKEQLIQTLEDIYALVETSQRALLHKIATGDECIAGVLSIAFNDLFLIIEKENKSLKELEAKQQRDES